MSAPVQNGSPDDPKKITPATFVAFLKDPKVRTAIEAMLPDGVTYDRVVREVINAAAENPDIVNCEPSSIVRAISKAVTYDLVIGEGVFLVPRKDRANDAQPKLRCQLGYQGKIELMLRYRAAKFIDYHVRYEHEHYRCEFGTNGFVEHKPIMDPAKRGKLIGAYAFAKMTQFDCIIIEMHVDEIDAIRQKFSLQWKVKYEGYGQNRKTVPLPLDEIPWYCEARVVHRLAKKVPKRGKLAEIIAADEVDDEALEAVEAGTIARREIGPGAAEPTRTGAAGPGLEEIPVERVKAADAAGASGALFEDFQP